ncbi:MAG: BON domain-containing protein, partial [Planctomycetales bacterium]
IVAAAAIVACGIATHTHRDVSTAAPFAAAGPPDVATATFTGSAESDALRERAGRVAAEVSGVLRVENRLQDQSQAEYEEQLQREIRKHLRMDELP